MQTDYIWDELSKVYNMSDVPDKAKSIIGDLMLKLDESSAQPDHLADVSKKGDLISRRDALSLIASFITQYRKECNVADIYDAILHMTAAQPEIVRCKDCKHYVDVRNRLTVNGSQGKCESLGMMYTHSEWYCGNAEREEDG